MNLKKGHMKEGEILDVMIQRYEYEGHPPGTIEYVFGLDPSLNLLVS